MIYWYHFFQKQHSSCTRASTSYYSWHFESFSHSEIETADMSLNHRVHYSNAFLYGQRGRPCCCLLSSKAYVKNIRKQDKIWRIYWKKKTHFHPPLTKKSSKNNLSQIWNWNLLGWKRDAYIIVRKYWRISLRYWLIIHLKEVKKKKI